jgi:nicotinamide-nucleotide amidase
MKPLLSSSSAVLSPPAPRVEIITTGTEILQGLYVDQHSARLSRKLEALGFCVTYHHSARDDRSALEALLREVAARADAIVMTGGLGPTEDDVNRDAIAQVWETALRLDAGAEQMMRARFEQRSLVMPERNVIQAMIPEGATVFYNPNGTAPGFGVPAGIPPAGKPRAALVALPGPASEWTPMWERDAGPWLSALFPKRPSRYLTTLHISMLPESVVNQLLSDLFAADARVNVTILAERGHVRLRFVATTEDSEHSQALAEEYAALAAARLPSDVLLHSRAEEWSLEQEINLLLRDGTRSITVAESCTGGMVAARLTETPGSSAYFHRGFVVYSNEAKRDLLGVPAESLDNFGAVSRECVEAMARGARRCSGADAAVAISGIAGPEGGTPEKPVGTVWLALDSADRGGVVLRRFYPGHRSSVREWAARQGLDLLRRWAAGLPWPTDEN